MLIPSRTASSSATPPALGKERGVRWDRTRPLPSPGWSRHRKVLAITSQYGATRELRVRVVGAAGVAVAGRLAAGVAANAARDRARAVKPDGRGGCKNIAGATGAARRRWCSNRAAGTAA